MCADIKVAISQQFLMESCIHPIPVAAECSDEESLVVSSQEIVKPSLAFGLELQKVRVDKLHDVIAAQTGEQTDESQEIQYAAHRACRLAIKVDIARIVSPFVAIGNYGYAMSQMSQTFSQRGVEVAVFAYQKYLHCLQRYEKKTIFVSFCWEYLVILHEKLYFCRHERQRLSIFLYDGISNHSCLSCCAIH